MRRIFELCASGLGFKKIADTLNREPEKYPPPPPRSPRRDAHGYALAPLVAAVKEREARAARLRADLDALDSLARVRRLADPPGSSQPSYPAPVGCSALG